MKINKKFAFATLPALAATLLFQTSITRADDNERGDQNQPIPVAIYDTFKRDLTTTPGFGSSWTGVVTVIIGPHVVTGTSRMDVCPVTNGIAYCTFTWVIPGEGTLVTSSSVCKLAGNNGIGAWSIEKGTGSFKHFKAIGTETFGVIPTADPAFALGYTNFERFAGIGRVAKRGDDRHGDD